MKNFFFVGTLCVAMVIIAWQYRVNREYDEAVQLLQKANRPLVRNTHFLLRVDDVGGIMAGDSLYGPVEKNFVHLNTQGNFILGDQVPSHIGSGGLGIPIEGGNVKIFFEFVGGIDRHTPPADYYMVYLETTRGDSEPVTEQFPVTYTGGFKAVVERPEFRLYFSEKKIEPDDIPKL